MIVRALVVYAGLYGSSAAVVKLLGFLVFLWLARSLSIDDYANFGLLYALQQGIATFGLAGIVEAVVGLLREHRVTEQQPRLFASANIAFLIMTLGAIGFSILIWFIYFNSSGLSVLAYAAVLAGGVFLALSSLQAQLVRLEEKHYRSLLFSFLPPLGGVIGGFVAFTLEKTVPAFFAGVAAGILISLLGLGISRVRGWRSVTGLTKPNRILRGAVPFMFIAFLGWLSGYGNNFVIDAIFTSADVAQFTFALTLSSIMLLVANALNQVWAPHFFRIVHEEPFEEVERKNNSFFQLLGFVLGLAGGLVLILYPTLIGLLGGNLFAYSSLRPELALLFAAYVVLTPWWHCHNHFLARAMGGSLLKLTLITSAAGISALLVLMWILGPIGIYVGFLVQMLLRAVGIFLSARSKWPVKVSLIGVVAGSLMILGGLLLSVSKLSLTASLSVYGLLFIGFGVGFVRGHSSWLAFR